MYLPVFVCLSLCLLARLLKNACMDLVKCCVSTDVGTWTNWLTFEGDPDYSPDAGTGLLSMMRCYAEFYYVKKIPHIRIGGHRYSEAYFWNGFIHCEPSEHLCRRYMRSTECLSSFKWPWVTLTMTRSVARSLCDSWASCFQYFHIGVKMHPSIHQYTPLLAWLTRHSASCISNTAIQSHAGRLEIYR